MAVGRVPGKLEGKRVREKARDKIDSWFYSQRRPQGVLPPAECRRKFSNFRNSLSVELTNNLQGTVQNLVFEVALNFCE